VSILYGLPYITELGSFSIQVESFYCYLTTFILFVNEYNAQWKDNHCKLLTTDTFINLLNLQIVLFLFNVKTLQLLLVCYVAMETRCLAVTIETVQQVNFDLQAHWGKTHEN